MSNHHPKLVPSGRDFYTASHQGAIEVRWCQAFQEQHGSIDVPNGSQEQLQRSGKFSFTPPSDINPSVAI